MCDVWVRAPSNPYPEGSNAIMASTEDLRAHCLELLNGTRSGGLKPLKLDEEACVLAQEYAKTMAEDGTLGHATQGLKPYQRYGLKGMRNHVLESVWGKEVEEGESMRELVKCARDNISQRDETKPHAKKEFATHAGFGFFSTDRHFRYVELIVTALVELDGVSVPQNLCATELTLSGTVLTPDLGPFCALVYFDERENVNETHFYEDFGAQRVHVAWPWDFEFSLQDKSFSTRLKFGTELKPSGTYYVQLFLRPDPATISYDKEIEDIEIPGTTSAAATGLVLTVQSDQEVVADTTSMLENTESTLAELAARKRAWDAAKAPDAEPLTAIAIFQGSVCPDGYEHTRHADGVQGELLGVGYKRLALDEVDLTNEDAAEPQVVVDVALCSDDTPVPKGYIRLKPSIDENLQLCVCYAPASDDSQGLQALVDIVVVYAASESFVLEAGYEQLPLGSSTFLCLKREGAGRAAYLQAAQQGILSDDENGQNGSDDDQELLDTELTPSKVRAREEERLRLLEEAQALADKEAREAEEERKREEKRIEIQRLQKEKSELLEVNAELQKKIVEVLSTRSSSGNGDSSTPRKREEAQEQEMEKQYSDTLAAILQLKRRGEERKAEFDRKTSELQAKLDEKEFKAKKIAESFREFKHEIALSAENSRTSKPIPRRVIAQFEELEQAREAELEKVRLKHINLKMTLKKVEQKLRAKEQLADGLHLIDFEQLKIENQTLSEKIEDRNDELAKLKKKNEANVQVLTHVKEKLQFVQAETVVQQAKLSKLDAQLAEARDEQVKAKAKRDVLRAKEMKAKENQGLAGSAILLRDYEMREKEMEQMRQRVAELQERHAHLAAIIASRKKKKKCETIEDLPPESPNSPLSTRGF